MVLTMPGAYHAGFAHGFSVAESSNFADAAWFEAGHEAARRMAQAGVNPAFDIAQLTGLWRRRVINADIELVHDKSCAARPLRGPRGLGRRHGASRACGGARAHPRRFPASAAHA